MARNLENGQSCEKRTASEGFTDSGQRGPVLSTQNRVVVVLVPQKAS